MSERPDPTKMRNQPSLRTSSGRIWLVIGGLFAALTGTLFVLLAIQTQGATRIVAIAASAAILLCFLVIVITRITVSSSTVKLRTMAIAMLSMAVIALVCMWLAGMLRAGTAPMQSG